MRRLRTTIGLVGLLLIGGCANVPRDARFADVRATVAQRTGGMRLHWNQGTAADRDVEAAVGEFLAGELTEDRAVQIALLNNRNLQATFEDLMIAQSDLVRAGLLKNPVFDAEIRFPAGGGGTGLEMSLVQDFIDLLFIPLRQRVAGAAFEAAKQRVAGRVLNLAGDVRTTFYSVQAAQQMLVLRRQVVSATEASYDLALRLRAAGNITELDLANERALHEQSKLELRSAEAEAEQSRERLNALMGLWGQQTAWTAAPRLPDPPAQEADLAGIERGAIERSLDLEAARRQVEVAAAALGVAAPLGLGTEVELGAAAEREGEGEWSVGPAVSLPIPLFNQGQPAVASARAELRRARQRHAALAVEIRARARAAGSALTAARERADYYRRVLLPLRQKIVEQTQLQYNAMQVGTFQLLSAKQQQIDAGADYVRALRDYWTARARVELILSGGSSVAQATNGGETPETSPGSSREGH